MWYSMAEYLLEKRRCELVIRKISISVPEDILKNVDRLAREAKLTRSALISKILREVSRASDDGSLIARINDLFNDSSVQEEQRRTADLFFHLPKHGHGKLGW